MSYLIGKNRPEEETFHVGTEPKRILSGKEAAPAKCGVFIFGPEEVEKLLPGPRYCNACLNVIPLEDRAGVRTAHMLSPVRERQVSRRYSRLGN